MPCHGEEGGGTCLAMVADDEVSPNLPIHFPGRETFMQLVRYTYYAISNACCLYEMRCESSWHQSVARS